MPKHWGAAIVALLAGACSSTAVDEAPRHVHAPLECTFTADEAFPALELAGGHRFTFAWAPAVSPGGELFVPIQLRFGTPQYLTGVARFDGEWHVETLEDRLQQIYGVAASEHEAWLWGERLEPREPALLRRRDGAWSPWPLPEGTKRIRRVVVTSTQAYAAVELDGSAAIHRLDGESWTAVAWPWSEAHPGALDLIGDTVVASAFEGSYPEVIHRLVRIDGDRVVEIVTPRFPTITAIAGTGLHDLLVLADDRVYWIDAIGGRAKLVHQDRSPYSDLWSPRPGVALLAPGTQHAGRLTVLDGLAGPREIELPSPSEAWSIDRFAATRDGTTIHFLALHAGGYAHYVGRCP